MPYEESKTVKLVGKLFVVFVLLLFFTLPFHERMQKAYFDLVVSNYQKNNGMENIVWHEVSWFDAEVHYFYGTNATEIAFTKCVRNWAVFLVDEGIAQAEESRPDAKTALVRSISGQHFLPPEENFGFRFIKYYRVNSLDAENGL